MAQRTTRWLQQRQGDAPTKGLAWAAIDADERVLLQDVIRTISIPAEANSSHNRLRVQPPRAKGMLQQDHVGYAVKTYRGTLLIRNSLPP